MGKAGGGAPGELHSEDEARGPRGIGRVADDQEAFLKDGPGYPLSREPRPFGGRRHRALDGLSKEGTRKGRLQRACLALLREHEADGALGTSAYLAKNA